MSLWTITLYLLKHPYIKSYVAIYGCLYTIYLFLEHDKALKEPVCGVQGTLLNRTIFFHLLLSQVAQ